MLFGWVGGVGGVKVCLAVSFEGLMLDRTTRRDETGRDGDDFTLWYDFPSWDREDRYADRDGEVFVWADRRTRGNGDRDMCNLFLGGIGRTGGKWRREGGNGGGERDERDDARVN